MKSAGSSVRNASYCVDVPPASGGTSHSSVVAPVTRSSVMSSSAASPGVAQDMGAVSSQPPAQNEKPSPSLSYSLVPASNGQPAAKQSVLTPSQPCAAPG